MLQKRHTGKIQLAAFGEFMMRLHSMEAQRFMQAASYQLYYAGAEANTCILLARLGVPVRYITRLPDNDIAMAGIGALNGQGVDTGKVLYGGEKMGLYFTEQGNGIRSTRVIYAAPPGSTGHELPDHPGYSTRLFRRLVLQKGLLFFSASRTAFLSPITSEREMHLQDVLCMD